MQLIVAQRSTCVDTYMKGVPTPRCTTELCNKLPGSALTYCKKTCNNCDGN